MNLTRGIAKERERERDEMINKVTMEVENYANFYFFL